MLINRGHNPCNLPKHGKNIFLSYTVEGPGRPAVEFSNLFSTISEVLW